jgi:hypothetical protein
VQLRLWPTFPRGTSFGHQYAEINSILVRLAKALEVDLWTLDAVFWHVSNPERLPGATGAEEVGTAAITPLQAPMSGFALERHLEDFLFYNWDQTSLSSDWELYTVPGNREAGKQFTCAAGRIDLLARHKRETKWLVIELKRGETSDEAVGQVLRYMGWVQLNLAEAGEEVHGLIVAQAIDPLLSYLILRHSSRQQIVCHELRSELSVG